MRDKVYVVAEYVHSSQNSTGYFWEKLIEKLVSDGCQAEVLSFTKDKVYRKRGSRFIRVFDKLQETLRLAFLAVKTVRKNSIVLSGTNPEFLMLVLALIKPFLRFKWFVFVSDVFPDNLIPAKIINKKSLFYRLLFGVYRRVYRMPDKLLAVGRDMQDILAEKTGSYENVYFSPHWVDLADISVVDKSQSALLNRLGWNNKVVFQFFGNMGPLQDINNLLLAISLAKAENAAFLFIGQGTESGQLVEYIRNHPEKPVHYYGELPQNEKNLGLAACDVAIVSLVPGMKGFAVPSKAYFSLAADKPILAVMDEGSEISLMVEEEGIGWVCPAGDPGVLAITMDRICEENLSKYSGKLQRLARTKYSEKVILNRLTTVINS